MGGGAFSPTVTNHFGKESIFLPSHRFGVNKGFIYLFIFLRSSIRCATSISWPTLFGYNKWTSALIFAFSPFMKVASNTSSVISCRSSASLKGSPEVGHRPLLFYHQKFLARVAFLCWSETQQKLLPKMFLTVNQGSRFCPL